VVPEVVVMHEPVASMSTNTVESVNTSEDKDTEEAGEEQEEEEEENAPKWAGLGSWLMHSGEY
jgi:predicted GTPase